MIKKCVLVVDDEPDLLALMQGILQAELPEAEVVAATSGPAALALMAKRPVDVIVADYKMPGMDGIELLQKATGIHAHLGKILATAFADSSLAERAEALAGVDFFFTKPVDPPVLIDAVRALLGL